MFGMIKNLAVNISLGDLDRCIFFLTASGGAGNSQKLVTQIANTINHWCSELGNERVQLKSVHDHFQNLKNKVLREKSLQDHKDSEFCSYYILMCFFACLMLPNNENSKIAAVKILDMCESKCEPEFRQTISTLFKPLRQLFRG